MEDEKPPALKGSMTRTLRALVYGVIIACGFILLVTTDYPLLVQALVLVVMAFIGTLALYRPNSEATMFLSLAVALLMLSAAATATGWGPAFVVVVASATPIAILLGRRNAKRRQEARR